MAWFKRDQKESAVKDPETLLRVVQRVSDAVVIADKNGIILYVSPAIEKIRGWERQEIEGTNLKEWGRQMGQEYHETMWGILEQKKMPFQGEVRSKRKSGDEYTANVYIEPLADAEGNIRGFIAVEQDITSEQAVVRLRVRTEDLHIANEILVQEKARDEALLASIGEGLIATDTEGRVVHMNSAVEEMLGWKVPGVIGQRWDEFLRVEDEEGQAVPLEQRLIRLVLASGKKYTDSTHCYIRRDGSKFPVVVTVAPVLLDHKVIGAIEVFRDITKEKEIDKMKTEFLSLASHQLRTPLTAIKLFIEMLMGGRRGKLNTYQQEYLDQIAQSTERMIALVNDLLNVSRIETGRLKIEPEPTDPIQFIHDVIKEVDLLAKEHTCAIVFAEPSTSIPSLSIDRSLLRQVLLNLLHNAVRYSVSEQCSITIRLEENDGDEYVMTVEDSGIGIPKDAQSRMFEKFFRAENAQKQEATGSGLGLYVAKMLVEAWGGQISFESEEGKGTKFYVTIPMAGMKKKEGEKRLAG